MVAFRVVFAILAFILGSSFGSFAALVAYRVPKGISIIKPDSHCTSCQNPIKPIDNIPVLSWIILKGKCRYCDAKIGVFPFVIEICGGLGFMFAYLEYVETLKTFPMLISSMALIFLFLIIAAIDYETHEIYNITLVLFALIATFISTYRILVFNASFLDHILGLALGFGFFGFIKLISKIITKREALGSGDVYLVGIAGLMLGSFPLLIAILISTLLGSVVELIKIKIHKSKREVEIAFGPYLLLGIGIMAIYGDAFMNFYWEVLINALI